MLAAFKMFFATLASLFSATQKLAASADHMASYVEGEAKHFNDRTTLVRIQEIKRIQGSFQQEDHDLAAAERQRQEELTKPQVKSK